MRLATLLSNVALIGLLACSGEATTTEPVLRARTAPWGVQVSNATDRPIYYMVVEAAYAMTAFIVPCTDPARCAPVPPGEVVIVPYSAITGYTKDARAAMVYSWHLEPAADGRFSLVGFRGVVVKL